MNGVIKSKDNSNSYHDNTSAFLCFSSENEPHLNAVEISNIVIFKVFIKS